MDSKSQEKSDSKAEFRKNWNDAANRKYRRRSPIKGSSASSDGIPPRERSSSPVPSRKETAKVSDDRQKGNDDRDVDRDHYRGHKHSDRQSSRSYHRHDGRNRRDKYVNDYDRDHSKLSYPSGRDCRSRDKDTSDRAGYDERQAKFEERNSDKVKEKHTDGSPPYRRNEPSSRRDINSSGYHLKETSRDGERYTKEENRRRDYRYREQDYRKPHERFEDTKGFSIKDQETGAKKPKLVNSSDPGILSHGNHSTSKQTQEASEAVATEKIYVTDADIDAAKIAAMKAAELVNKNLIGTGVMSTDQKKKLLWGNKKNTTTEESAHHWDTSTFGDRERQEKFKKFMGVKGDLKLDPKPDNPDVEKQREQLQLDLEKQYTAGLRRKDGRTVGLGL